MTGCFCVSLSCSYSFSSFPLSLIFSLVSFLPSPHSTNTSLLFSVSFLSSSLFLYTSASFLSSFFTLRGNSHKVSKLLIHHLLEIVARLHRHITASLYLCDSFHNRTIEIQPDANKSNVYIFLGNFCGKIQKRIALLRICSRIHIGEVKDARFVFLREERCLDPRSDREVSFLLRLDKWKVIRSLQPAFPEKEHERGF